MLKTTIESGNSVCWKCICYYLFIIYWFNLELLCNSSKKDFSKNTLPSLSLLLLKNWLKDQISLSLNMKAQLPYNLLIIKNNNIDQLIYQYELNYFKCYKIDYFKFYTENSLYYILYWILVWSTVSFVK